MKNLAEKREELIELKVALGIKKKEADDLAVKVKAEVDDDALTQLQSDAQGVADSMADLNTQIQALTEDITAEESASDDAAKALKNQKEKGFNKVEKTKYLETKEAAADWLKTLNDSPNRGDFSKNYQSLLKTKGITGTDVFAPKAVLTVIKDFFDEYEGLLAHVATDPSYVYDVTAQTVRNFATGRTDENTEKTEASFNFKNFTINVDEIYSAIKIGYKMQKLDKAVNSGKMVDKIIKELIKSVVRGVEKQIIVGADTTLPNLKGIQKEVNTDLVSTAQIDLSAATFTNVQVQALTAGLEQISAEGAPVIVTTKALARKFKSATGPDGKYLDANPLAMIKNGLNEILGMTFFVYDFMDTATYPITAFADGSYLLIGDSPTNPDFLESYDIYPDNKGSYEAVGLIGGSLVEWKSAVNFEEPAA